MTETVPAPNNTTTIVRNSFWLAVERAVDFTTGIAVSVAVARALGPATMGYFTYFAWLTNTAGRFGTLGISQSINKYSAEFFGRGRPGVVRTLFDITLRLQVVVALFITCVGLVVMAAAGDPRFHLVTALMILSILPGLINGIPSQLNNSAERLAANVPGTIVSSVIYIVAIAATIHWNWGLVGLGLGILAMRTGEMIVRLVPAMAWMRRIPREPLPEGLKRKVLVFSGQGLVLLLLAAVVWDRSEVFFLKRFCTDIRQVAFYSVAFGITQSVASLVEVIAHGVGVSVMAQYGRDPSRLGPMVSGAVRYLTLVGLPLFLGLAALSVPIVNLMYGAQYGPAIPVLAISALLAIPRILFVPVQQMLRASEQQGFVVRWLLLTAALNLTLDFLLIPRYGAIGAAFANGIAQTIATIGLWIKASRFFSLHLPWRFLSVVTVCALPMTAVVATIAFFLYPVAAIPVSLIAGAGVFFLMLRWTGALETEDRERLVQLRRQFPSPMHRGFDLGVGLLMPIRRTEV